MYKTGFSKDIHHLKSCSSSFCLRLGGIDLNVNYQIIAYSDGDVILHAVSEAILGALGMRDIGFYFNPKNSKQNFNSQEILNFTLKQMQLKKYHISNIDLTIVFDAFQLNPFYLKIRNSLATLLEISNQNIGLKFTTSENTQSNCIEANVIVMLKN